MKDVNVNEIVKYLKTGNFGYFGLASPDPADETEFCTENVAIIAYVLQTLGYLDQNEREFYIKKILTGQNLSKEGHTKYAFVTINKMYSTWATAQACLALRALGCPAKCYINSLYWLCDQQNYDGGWSFNGISKKTQIIYSFYSIIILKHFSSEDRIKKALQKAAAYLMDILYKKTQMIAGVRLAALFLLNNLGVPTDASIIQGVVLDFVESILTKNYSLEFSDFDKGDQHVYFVEFYTSAYYLLLREFIPPDDAISLYFIDCLGENLIPDKGWHLNKDDAVCSWATALSLLTYELWEKDCKLMKRHIDTDFDKEKIMEELEKYKSEATKMKILDVCPLNGGSCNKVNIIRTNYDKKKVFIDIPYDDIYEDCEKKIFSILLENGKIPVVAKEDTTSNIIMCKICRKIQSCAYGIADLSYSKLNIFFELGLMYGTNKKCAILKNNNASIPSDLAGIEYLEYANTRELGEKLMKWLSDNT